MAKINKTNDAMDKLAAQLVRSYGADSASLGGFQKKLNSVPTGSLALDFELGTGGWPLGYLAGVFGPRDIGKSSMIGFNAIRNAQAMDLNCAWVAYEPFAEEWALKNGVNVDELLLVDPLTGEEAFGMLHDIIRSGVVDFVVFDSVGAILSESEMEEDGKARQGGQAGLITWGSKAAAKLAYRNNTGVIMLNHVRDNMKSRIPGVVQQPGGHALEHVEHIIVQLKHGSGRYTIKENGTDIQVGGEVIAHVLRNKHTEGKGQKATFDYFYKETEQYPFGIDSFNDVINTAKRTGAIVQRGSMYDLPDGASIKSLASVIDYLKEKPEVFEQVREAVLQIMLDSTAKPAEEAEDAGV